MQRFLLVPTALAMLAAAAPATAAPRASNASEPAPVRAGKVTLKPERSFSLVGFSWRGPTPDLEVRARGRDGRWTRWSEVPTDTLDGPDRGRVRRSAPVWTGPADRIQYRLHDRPRRLRAQFVRVRGKAAPTRRNRVSAAGSGPPPIVPRSSWDPRGQCRPRSSPDHGQVKLAFVHHTVTLNEYAPEEAAGIVLAICRYHRNSNGWNDIGYNFLVDKYGTLYEGRAGGIDQPVIGAQAQGFNAQSTGISNIGSHEQVPQTDAAIHAMAALLRWKLPLHGAATAGRVSVTSAGGSSSRYPAGRTVSLDRISGHRDGNHTACPGAALYAQLPTLRSIVNGEVAPSTTPDGQITMSADRSAVTYGDLVLLNGTATSAGAPLSNAPISFGLALGNGRGRAARSPLTTSGDGSFRARIRARYSGAVTAHAAGLASPPVPIQVAVDLEATLRSADVRRRGRVVVSGSVRRGSRARTRVVVRRLSADGTREVKRRKLRRARRGSFRVRMRLRRRGDYQVIVVAPTNRLNRGSVVRLPLRVR
jgi:hypothetical protein